MPSHKSSMGGLICGLIIGLGIALLSVITPSSTYLDNTQVVAHINGQQITQEKYQSHLTAAASGSSIEAKEILQRLIEEELLVQRGVELGFLQNNQSIREAMVKAMIAMTTASAQTARPSDSELKNFYEESAHYFTPSAKLQVRQLVVMAKPPEVNIENSKTMHFNVRDRALQAYTRLMKGEGFDTVNTQLGSPTPLPIPNKLMSSAKMAAYLGAEPLKLLLKQEAGFISQPLPKATPMEEGFKILQIIKKQPSQQPDFSSIRNQIEVEYVRRSGDKKLREYLLWLKDRADIQYSSDNVIDSQ